MANQASNQSYSHTHHFVSTQQFNECIQGLLNGDKLAAEKKPLLQTMMQSDIWSQIQQSSYWRHNIFNGGLSGPFTEYFACFDPQWKVDFWGERVQPIDVTYLNEHAIPRAYHSTVLKTQQVLSEKAKEIFASEKQNVSIASLACGTMYDVLGANYEHRKNIVFFGYDVDQESLHLAQEKAKTLGYDTDQIKLHECDIINFVLPENQFDIITCNGFSFYVQDGPLSQLIKNVKKALKPNGIFLMSFIQPPTMWQMNNEEKKVNQVVKTILDAIPKKWSANLRTGTEVLELVTKGGFTVVSVLEETHNIHPLVMAHKV